MLHFVLLSSEDIADDRNVQFGAHFPTIKEVIQHGEVEAAACGVAWYN